MLTTSPRNVSAKQRDSASARLDRLHVGRFHKHLMCLLAYVFFFEFGDLNNFGLLWIQWKLSMASVGFITSAAFVGMFVGALRGRIPRYQLATGTNKPVEGTIQGIGDAQQAVTNSQSLSSKPPTILPSKTEARLASILRLTPGGCSSTADGKTTTQPGARHGYLMSLFHY
jgi:hypothetical protein